MQPHLIKALHADYIPAAWSGKDTSGIRVVGKTVLILLAGTVPFMSFVAEHSVHKDVASRLATEEPS